MGNGMEGWRDGGMEMGFGVLDQGFSQLFQRIIVLNL